ncbi:hypothetical protein [Actinocorallia sp. A-T 12471]|uniref:hypothetical protein n=1 Tax=Actinocorallia sp. A-T 12471 TaxID=3089813 RepID=UPI0029CD2203|nr:hypothetical protein [Actinocorallia sp. A-T 12471]MDX6743336.1 hypothetical protein [Actinocorallia sp. A-T 12471]
MLRSLPKIMEARSMSRQLKRALVGAAAALALVVSGGTSVAAAIGTAATGAGAETIESVAVAAHLRAAKPKPAAVTFAVNPLVGGKKTTGTVRLSAPAPAGGAKVMLASKNPAFVKVPASVKVKAGKRTATFTAKTKATAKKRAVAVTATLNGKKAVKKLKLTPKRFLKGMTLSQATVPGGTALTGTVTLNSPAPAKGVGVRLESSSFRAEVDVAVTVPAGQRTAVFNIGTQKVAAQQKVKISAAYGGVTLSRTLTLTAGAAAAPELYDIVVHKDAAFVEDTVEADVVLTGPAPAGGAAVEVTSNKPGNVVFDAQGATKGIALIPAGQPNVKFYFGFKNLTGPLTFTISATYNGKTVVDAQTFTVTPLAAG